MTNVGADLLLVLQLITLHTLEGKELHINKNTIIMFGPPKMVTDKAKCVVTFVDGKFVGVAETCDEIRALMR